MNSTTRSRIWTLSLLLVAMYLGGCVEVDFPFTAAHAGEWIGGKRGGKRLRRLGWFLVAVGHSGGCGRIESPG